MVKCFILFKLKNEEKKERLKRIEIINNVIK